MNTAISMPGEKLRQFCKKWKIKEMSLFGSVLRSDFNPTSDVDFLVSFKEEVNYSLGDLFTAQEELELIIGRPVDLVEKFGIEKSHNAIRRSNILDNAQLIYAE